MWIWEHFKYSHRVASAATHILLLYRVTINTTLAGLPSGFAFGLLIKFYASVLQQELIWARAMFALCIKHKSRHACADSACWSSLSVVSLRDCGWQCLKYFSQVCKVSFIFWKKFKSYCRGKRRKVHLSFFSACYTSGCSFMKASLAVWQRHVQHMPHVQTLWCPIGNSCAEIPLLWSREVCKQPDLT